MSKRSQPEDFRWCPAPLCGEKEVCWRAWFDGAALPNPGKLGLGVVLQSPDGTRLEYSERGEGVGCSNEAELQAVCAALSFALAAGAQCLVVSGDSDFAVRHVAGNAHTAVPRLLALIDKAQALAARFQTIEWQWVPRYRNGDADRLSRRVLGLVHKPAPHPAKALADKRRRRKG
ncbi:MAG: ribonuclease HI family protein [Azoarcus sp.]